MRKTFLRKYSLPLVQLIILTGLFSIMPSCGGGGGGGNSSVGSQPHIYVADWYNNRIVRMDDMTGAGWTALGTIGTGTNQCQSPVGVFVNTAGKIYVADQFNARIVRMDDMTGSGWTALGTVGTGTNQFQSP